MRAIPGHRGKINPDEKWTKHRPAGGKSPPEKRTCAQEAGLQTAGHGMDLAKGRPKHHAGKRMRLTVPFGQRAAASSPPSIRGPPTPTSRPRASARPASNPAPRAATTKTHRQVHPNWGQYLSVRFAYPKLCFCVERRSALPRSRQQFHRQRFMSTQPLGRKITPSASSRRRWAGQPGAVRPVWFTTRWQG